MYTMLITHVMFCLYVITGKITPAHDEVDGRPLYHITTDDIVIENAYKEEVLEYLATGTFEYNEDY